MEVSDDVMNLLSALEGYKDAKEEHDKLRDSGSGYGWSYHGHYAIENLDKAQVELETNLNKVIENRVKKVLQDLGITKAT